MSMIMMLPYFCQINQQSVFLRLNERGELCLQRKDLQSEWRPEEVIHKECRCFAAAPDARGSLHVIAVDGKRKLTYFLVGEADIRQPPFIIKNSPHHIILSFYPGGSGCFFSSDSSNRLICARYTLATGWSEEKPGFNGDMSVPVCLITDKSGRLHLITYSLTDGSLLYRCGMPGQKWTEPVQLDTALELPLPPALWIDASLNVHTAWYVPRQHSINYRLKKAGGWPQGGWQPEQYLQANMPVRLLSFHEQPDSLKIWLMGDGGQIQIFSRYNGEWDCTEHETGFRLPVRFGFVGGEWYNLADSLPATGWFFTAGQEEGKDKRYPTKAGREQIKAAVGTDWQEAQEQQLLIQIMELMEENRNLKAILNEKDEALARYRAMPEEDFYKKQHAEQKAAIKKLEGELRRRDSELKSYKDQVERLQKQLAARETEQKTDRAEITALRQQISQYQQQKASLSSAIRKLEQELARKKGIFGSISSLFHKRE